MSKRLIKAILFGSGEFAVPALEALAKPPFELVAVVTQPDQQAGRGQKAVQTPVKTAAKALNVAVLEPNEPASILAELSKLSPDVIVVVDYGKIIPRSVIDLGPIVNLHPSLLPKYRGATPVQTALLNGEKSTGLTMIELDEKLDHGAIIAQESVSITNDTAASLNTKLVQLVESFLRQDLPRYLDGELTPVPQNESEASFSKKLTKSDGKIEWSRPAEQILCQIRALNPWPGTYTTWNGKLVKILEAELLNKPIPAGHVDEGELIVGTSKGSLRIRVLQLAGRKPLSASEFLVGNRSILGSILR